MTQESAVSRPSGATREIFWRLPPPNGRPAAALGGLLLAAWLATGLAEVRFSGRAVYQLFGAPVAVLHPGLHLLFPWPFSTLRPLDFGAVRQVGVPGVPGARLLYRVGLTDAQAMDAAYETGDPDALVQAVASQVAVESAGLHASAIQAALDRLGTGLEILDVTGPPPPADTSADLVRAAAIDAQTALVEARGQAAAERAAARQKAAAAVAAARAAAAEMVVAARVQMVEFTADRQANAADSKSFLLERYFANLTRAIGTAPKTIIDHRLNWPAAPELDLRPPPGVAK